MASTYTREAKLATKARQDRKNADDSRTHITPPSTLPTASSAAVTAPTIPGVPATASPPSYYNNAVGLTASTDKTSFSRLANALLPFFSRQDQTSVATFLNTQDPTGLFKDYLGNLNLPSAQSVDKYGKTFQASKRAIDALTRLDTMRQAAGLSEEQLGSGYKFLKQAMGLLSKYGIAYSRGEQGLTRAEYENLQAELEALTTQAQGDRNMAPYAELATKFINPTLIGTLFPKSNINGVTVYGQANKKRFV